MNDNRLLIWLSMLVFILVEYLESLSKIKVIDPLLHCLIRVCLRGE